MHRRLIVLFLVLTLLLSCAKEKPAGRVILLGIDGMDPETVDLLMSEGKLPNFAKMRQEGAYGPLQSAEPLLSPILWTTIATGRQPTDHGIGHFTAVNQQTGEQLPVTSAQRRVDALWNILSKRDRRVAVVGWWATWPPERVNGAMVSDHTMYHFLLEQGTPDGGIAKTYPPEMQKEIEDLLTPPAKLGVRELAPYVDVTQAEIDRPFHFGDDLQHFRWAVAAAKSHRDIGLHLWKKLDPDTLMVYVEGVDTTSHLFGHLFRAQGLAGPLAEQQRRFGRAVENMYVFADSLVGDFMKEMDDDTTLVVISDHGFDLGVLQDDPSKLEDMRRVSERFHKPRGIAYLYGRGVKKRSRLDDASILDLTPTVLALNGVPAAKDMPGRVLDEALTVQAPPRVRTYPREGSSAVAAGDPRVDKEMMEKLRSLGYLGSPDAVGGAAVSSPSGERNLAALHFQAGRYEEAAKIYERLAKADPDDAAVLASLAGTLGAMEKYDEALKHLNRAVELQPINPEAYHNRAVIHARRGNRDAAIEDYRRAVRYAPAYEPSREALVRLGVSPDVHAPRNAAEKQAFTLAQQAGDLARRGDYAAATRAIDRAVEIAPQYALLYQYRANVAYLRGDKAAARAALEKALEIEPGNALFRENLKRLK